MVVEKTGFLWTLIRYAKKAIRSRYVKQRREKKRNRDRDRERMKKRDREKKREKEEEASSVKVLRLARADYPITSISTRQTSSEPLRRACQMSRDYVRDQLNQAAKL